MSDESPRDPASEEEFQLLSSHSGDDTRPIDVISDYLPEQDDWAAKTILEAEDPRRAVGILFMLDYFDDEIGEFREPIEDVLVEYFKLKTSTYGASRDEYRSILERLSGGGSTGDDKKGILRRVMSPPGED